METLLSLMGESNVVSSKLQSSMYMLLDPNVKTNHIYLDHLLRYLTEDDNSNHEQIEEDFFLLWLGNAVHTWSSNIYIPRNVLNFTINLTSFFIKKETFFIKLKSTNNLDGFISIMRAVQEPIQFTDIKISYVNLLSSVVQHNSGLEWLMQTNYWFDIVSMASPVSQNGLQNTSLSVLLQLLEESNRKDEIFCKKLIKTILTPLDDLALSALKDNDTSLLETSAMKETLLLIKNILTSLLKRSSKPESLIVLSNFIEENNLEKNLYDIISVIKNENSLLLISTVWYLVLFCQLNMSFRNKVPLQTFRFSQKMSNLIKDIVTNCKPYHKLFALFETGFMLGKYIFSAKSDEPKTDCIQIFQNQLLIYLLWPIFDNAAKINSHQDRKEKIAADEFRQDFISKFIRNIRSETYMNMRLLKNAINTFTVHDSVKSLESIQLCVPFMHHNVANTITQVLIYHFRDILTTLDSIQEVYFWPQDLIKLYIDTLVLFLKTFDLTWKDSVETVYVTDIAIQFLCQPFWDSKLVAKGLELLDVAISKCLSPSMALLLNDETDSQIKVLEDIILKNIGSESWEIRCMALQVVGTIAQKAKENFEIYVKMLIQASIPPLVMDITINDLNCQVKAKALQCLQEIIRETQLWNYLNKNKIIYDQLLNYFYQQEEGIVRSEALVLLKVIFDEQKLPKSFEQRIYECMVFALQDEHKLVRLQVLSFWNLVIGKQLEHEGMIDGSFPTVTFSKVLRKIITFDDATVKKCLLRVLHKLNEIGGLRVFIHIFENENDDEVFNDAVKDIDKFVELLLKYNICFSSFENGEFTNYSPSGGKPLEDDLFSEILDQESNCETEYPIQNKKTNQINIWDFLRNFDDYCKRRATNYGRSEDLNTILAKLFVD